MGLIGVSMARLAAFTCPLSDLDQSNDSKISVCSRIAADTPAPPGTCAKNNLPRDGKGSTGEGSSGTAQCEGQHQAAGDKRYKNVLLQQLYQARLYQARISFATTISSETPGRAYL